MSQNKCSPEEGVTLSEYPDYIIYDDGRVFSYISSKELKPTKREGYYHTKLMTVDKDGNRKRKDFRVHILVAKAYHPNPGGLPIVNHIDGDGYNNHRFNLEWVSHKRSIEHAYETGLMKPTCRPVLQFEKDGIFVKRYESVNEAAKSMCCYPSNISEACNGVNHTSKGYKWKFETQLEPIKDKEGERWKKIENHPKYKVSSLGRVHSKCTNRYMKFSTRKKNCENSYLRVELDRKKYQVHCLVANAFLGPPHPDLENPVVDHKDNNPRNNILSNLQWVEHDRNIWFAHNRDNSYNHRRVCQYSLDGEKLGEYQSAAEASRKMEVSNSAILQACNRKKSVHSIKDCIWRYSDEPLKEEDMKERKGKIKVLQYTLDGDLIKKYSSMAQGSVETGIHTVSISRNCSGKAKTAGGFKWKYA